MRFTANLPDFPWIRGMDKGLRQSLRSRGMPHLDEFHPSCSTSSTVNGVLM